MKFWHYTVSAVTLVQAWAQAGIAAESSPLDSQQELMSRWVRTWVSNPPRTRQAAEALQQELLIKPMGDAARGSSALSSRSGAISREETGGSPPGESSAVISSARPSQEFFDGRPKKRARSTQK